MSDEQLTQPFALTFLDDIVLQARYAYAGQTDPSSGVVQQGAAWIYDNVERLAAFDVTPYSSH